MLPRRADVEHVAVAPTRVERHGNHLLCPLCGYYEDKGKYDECDCGNISIDPDALRVHVEKTEESVVRTFNAVER